MTYDEFNAFCESLPATSYVMQWNNSHVWKVGGKLFAVLGWSNGKSAATFKVSELAFEVLSDMPGLRPAPYLASRGLKWIQNFDAPGLPDTELQAHIAASWRMIASALPRKKRAELGLDDALSE